MEENDNSDNGLSFFYRRTIAVALIWSLAIVASASWNVHNERLQSLALSRKEAVANFNKDMAFRLWGTKHGGVYVPPTEQTPPNPYLSHIPDRDITLPSGKRLTLMNPAYMVRQMMSDFNELYGVKGRITSLKPLNSANSPDAWEREALLAFEKGTKEFFVVTGEGRQQSLRLMRPMVVTEGCLKCHSQQGYKAGDIRGGVGVVVPMAPFLALERQSVQRMFLSHMAIWLLGAAALGLAFYRERSVLLAREKSKEELRESEARFRRVFQLVPLALSYVNQAGALVYVNDRFVQVFGYGQDEVSSVQEWWRLACPEEEYRQWALASWEAAVATAAQEKTGIAPLEYKVTCKNGTVRVVLMGGILLEGNLLCSFVDLTERRRGERENALMLKRVKALWEVSQMLDADLEALAHVTQEKLVEITDSEYAFYGFMNQDETAITVSTWSKEVMAACGVRHNPLEYLIADSGLWGDAVRERRTIIINDYAADRPGKKGVPEGHVKLSRLMSVPVFVDNRIVAVAVVANKPASYNEEDARQVEGVIRTMQLLVARKNAEEAWRQLNEDLERRVQERTAELAEKNSELEKMNKLFVGRELRMVELKARIEELENQRAGQLT
ncbi:MAG: DUF3365 domain-containing protein [Desulfobulbaceae bacterium]|nr:DUF3365 domain-containing protein [Desulfobulbaceae bacterium]